MSIDNPSLPQQPKRELTEIEKYQLEQVIELEKSFDGNLMGPTRYTDSQFARIGLPMLTGLLDNTFNALHWAEYMGSNYVPLEILSDDLKSVIFTLPPLLMSGPAIVNTGDGPSLSDRSTEIALQGAIIAENGDILINQLINRATGAMEHSLYGMNFKRAAQTIKSINDIYEHYGVVGRIEYPEGLTEPDAVPEASTASAKQENRRYDLDDGDAL